MELWQNELWRKYFGEGWKQLIAINAKIGAFLAVHETKDALIDDNAKSFLGFKKDPTYEELVSSVNSIQEHTKLDFPVQIQILDTESTVLAGFLHIVEETASSDRALTLFPISSPAQLLHRMTEDNYPSLLALIQIENVENPALRSSCISAALDAIYGILPNNAVIAAHGLLQFWIYVPDFQDNATELLNNLKEAVESCTVTDEFGSEIAEDHSMTITIGCSLDNPTPTEKMHTASFALYEAISNGTGSIRFFSAEQYELQKNEYQSIKVFSRLIDQNLFQYHFQPIVDAHTGEIIAYEALMRTDESIGLNPFQILDFAQRYNRLYDVEKATMYNTLAFINNNQEAFTERKLFVNSISAHILNDEDYQKLRADYGELMEKVVIELTEQTEISDEELARIHTRLEGDHMQMAIDDYGTGYSNTSNLLRYNPDIVKIDRSLISNIDSNEKVRNIVASIIEFLHASGYMALAEGVETYEELRCMIHLSADLIQGYYISRPKPILLHEISEDVKADILNINLEASSDIQRIYHPVNNEVVDIPQLVLEKYTDIFIDVANVTLTSDRNLTIPLAVTVKDNTKCDLTLRNVNIISVLDAPIIKLGNKCDVRIICEGNNKFEKKGISVPRTSSLRLLGSGSLGINCEAINCYAIGSSDEHSHGRIAIDMDGRLAIIANGDNCVAIGGGKNRDNNHIQILRGDLSITCSGATCVGVGCLEGPALIDISNCVLRFNLSSPSAIAIGAIDGHAEISMQNFSLKCSSTGATQGGVGVLHKGTGSIDLTDGTVDITLKGVSLSCVGTREGNVNCKVSHTNVTLYCEGGSVSGIGDISGGGDVNVYATDLSVTFLAGEVRALGSLYGSLVTEACKENIRINE